MWTFKRFFKENIFFPYFLLTTFLLHKKTDCVNLCHPVFSRRLRMFSSKVTLRLYLLLWKILWSFKWNALTDTQGQFSRNLASRGCWYRKRISPTAKLWNSSKPYPFSLWNDSSGYSGGLEWTKMQSFGMRSGCWHWRIFNISVRHSAPSLERSRLADILCRFRKANIDYLFDCRSSFALECKQTRFAEMKFRFIASHCKGFLQSDLFL